MRIRLSLIALTLLMGVAITSCKEKTTTPKTAEELQIEKLTGTWALDLSAARPVSVDNNDPAQNWTGFTLTLGNKTYNANTSANLGNELVWPSGTGRTWAFAPNDVRILDRDDGVEMTVAVTDTSLRLQFDYSDTGGRLNGITGNWVFVMVPQ